MKTRTKLLSAAVVGLTLLGGIYIAHSQDVSRWACARNGGHDGPWTSARHGHAANGTAR